MSFTKWVLHILLLLATSVAFGQPVEEWVAFYNGPGNGPDYARALAVDADGNIYVTGISSGIGTDEDYATVKYDPNGDMVWVARYNGPVDEPDYVKALALDGAGNVYVTGGSEGSGTGRDYATVKYNPSGNEVWATRYNGPGNGLDYGQALAADGAGNVYVTGFSEGSGTYEDYATIKYDANGNEAWVARYNGPADRTDYAWALALDAAGNVYVTGSSDFPGDYATIKYDRFGHELWVVHYDGPGNGNDAAVAVVVDGSGNVYVTGPSEGSGTGRDFATIKYDSDGDTVWVRRYNGPGNGIDAAEAVALDAQGNVCVTGRSEGSGTGYDCATIKYDPDGNELWVSRYNGPANGTDRGVALAADGAGNVYVTGRSEGSGTDGDYATVKYDPDGDEVWVARYNGFGDQNDQAYDLAVDAEGSVYVTGLAYEANEDYGTIKYSQPTAVETGTSGNALPTGFRLTCQPNPFNASTQISYTLAEPGEVELTIYNIGGQLIHTLVDDYREPGEYQVIWDASNYSSGIYFCKLTTGHNVITRKMNLLK